MPAPTIFAQGTVAAVTSGNLSVSLTEHRANDIVVIVSVGWVPNTTTGTNTMSLSSPWTKYSPDQTLITSSLIDGEWALWWARATGQDSLGANQSITRPTSWDTGTDTCWAGRAYTIRGCRTTGDPWDAITASALQTAANAAFPGVSYSDGNNLVVQFLASSDNQSSGAAPSGWTAGTEAASTTGTDCMFQTFRQTFSISGSGTSTASTSATGAPAQGRYIFFGASFTPPAITATATDSGTGTESASRVIVDRRTASDTGTGTETAVGTRVVKRTVTDAATSIENAISVFFTVFTRTATDASTGTETATRLRIVPRTATDAGTGTETAVGAFWTTFTRTATDTATGTETATRLRIVSRTASDTAIGDGSADDQQVHSETGTGSGQGTETATGNIVSGSIQRTGTATGQGSETAVGARLVQVTATATATGTETAARLITRRRTGTATAQSSETADDTVVHVRTATGSGQGSESDAWDIVPETISRNATSTAIGSDTAVGVPVRFRTGTDSAFATETALWVKSLMFRPPADDDYRWASYRNNTPQHRLFSRMVPGVRARNIYKLLDGTFTTVDPRDDSLVDTVYLGGHVYDVSVEEKADLIAAGYEVT